MNSPVIDQKSFLASSSSRVESAWRRESVWFSSKNFLFLSSFRTLPGYGGCSQTLFSPRDFYCSICDWEHEVSTPLRRWHFLFIEPSGVEFLRVHLLHFLNVCDHSVSLPDSRRVHGKTFEPNWCSRDWSATIMSPFQIPAAYNT